MLVNLTVKADEVKTIVPVGNRAHSDLPAVMWRQPGNVASKDLFYGLGGKKNQPTGTFIFVKEDMGGTNPKFLVRDSHGRRWKVKLGPEAKSETTATRFLWAVGYLVDEDYFIPAISVKGLQSLNRGQEFVSKSGTVRGARLERQRENFKKVGNWSWGSNPFVGTRELKGLAIMMSLINNWDLKKANNDIYQTDGEYQYVVSDVGASFGNAGLCSRNRADLKSYREARFVRKRSEQEVDLRLPTRPPLLYVFAFPYYIQRTRLANLVDDLPRDDIEWIGRLLSQLSSRQIADAFRAGGFSSQEVEGYSQAVRNRISELTRH